MAASIVSASPQGSLNGASGPSRPSATRSERASLWYEEGTLMSRAGGAPDLAWQLALPTEPRAAVLLVHGYGEHKGRYRDVVEAWGGMGIACGIFDLRGHGWSGGTRAHVDRFSEYLDDATDVMRLLEEKAPGAPLFIFGHSMGGLVASLYAVEAQRRLKGMVLSSPFFGIALEVPAVKALAGRVFSRLLPKLSLPTGLKGTDVTHDPTLARLYDIDPLVNNNATARWFTEAKAAHARVLERASQLTLPTLMIQAGADKVVSAPAAKRVFDRIGSKDKTYDERVGLYHEILNEPEGIVIAAEMARWILAHA